MTEEITRRVRTTYQEVRAAPVDALQGRLSQTPAPTARDLTLLRNRVMTMCATGAMIENGMLATAVSMEAKASFASSEFAGIATETDNNHAQGAAMAIGRLLGVSGELTGQSVALKGAALRILGAMDELSSAFASYADIVKDMGFRADMAVRTREAAIEGLQAYYTDIMGSNEGLES